MKSKKKVILICFAVLAGFYLLTEVLNGISVNGASHSYETHCGGCHGKEGEGLKGLVPPLANTDWLADNHEDLSCIIEYGIKGPISVNGKVYDEEMIGLDHLTDVQIANIVNYIGNQWLEGHKYLHPDSVRVKLKECK